MSRTRTGACVAANCNRVDGAGRTRIRYAVQQPQAAKGYWARASAASFMVSLATMASDAPRGGAVRGAGKARRWGPAERQAASPLGSSDTDDRPEPRGGGASGPTGSLWRKGHGTRSGKRGTGVVVSSVGVGPVPAARHSGAVSAPLPPRRAARRAWARRSAAVITPAPVPCDHAPVRPLVDSPAGRAASPRRPSRSSTRRPARAFPPLLRPLLAPPNARQPQTQHDAAETTLHLRCGLIPPHGVVKQF